MCYKITISLKDKIQHGERVGMKTFKNLNASDFPGVDTNKFDMWKKSVMETRLYIYIVLLIYLILNIKSYGYLGYIIYDTPIVILIGLLFITQHTSFTTERHPTYILVSLSFLIVFNVILQLITKHVAGESLVVIVLFFWLFNRNQKNVRAMIELGIDSMAIKRALSN